MNGSLFLFPEDPAQSCDPDSLVPLLAQLGVIGAALDECGVFAAGEHFPRHVVYAGCSPHLRFEPAHPGDRHFCHVALHGPFEQPRVLTGANTVKPRCPHCRARLGDWPQRLTREPQACPGCEALLKVTELDWRQHAAVGRCFIEMRNVFPGEASPSDQLLGSLQQHTDMPWNYAWAGLCED